MSSIAPPGQTLARSNRRGKHVFDPVLTPNRCSATIGPMARTRVRWGRVSSLVVVAGVLVALLAGGAGAGPRGQRPVARVYVVGPGDTLWRIAESLVGPAGHQREQRDGGGHRTQGELPDPDGRSDRRGDPQAGCRGEAADAGAVFDDGATTEEADADDDLRGDPCRIGLDTLVPAPDDGLKAVRGDDGEERRTQPDQDVRPKACRLVGELPFSSEQARQSAGQQEAEDEVGLRRHEGIMPRLDRQYVAR